MNPEQAQDAVSNLLRVKRSKKTYHYWACAKGPDDLPILIVARKEGPLRKEARAARKTAKAKIGNFGRVQVSDGGVYLFVVESGTLQPAKMQKLVRTKLATDAAFRKVAPMLRKATVLTDEELESRLEAGEVVVATPEEDSDFERLYARAEEQLAVVRSALRESPDHHRELDRLVSYLRQAQAVFDGGEAGTATDMLQEVIADTGELVQVAWRTESASVRAKYGQVRDRLREAHRSDPDAFTLAFRPLERLQGAAITLRDEGKLDEAFDALGELDRALDEVLFPEPEATPEELRQLDEELDRIGVPEDDPLDDDPLDEVDDASLQRIVQSVRIGRELRLADREAREGLRGFIAALRADPELSESLPLDALDTLFERLPDVGAVLRLTDATIGKGGDEAVFRQVQPALAALETALEDPRLSALEDTDLGHFPILTPLETALQNASATLT